MTSPRPSGHVESNRFHPNRVHNRDTRTSGKLRIGRVPGSATESELLSNASQSRPSIRKFSPVLPPALPRGSLEDDRLTALSAHVATCADSAVNRSSSSDPRGRAGGSTGENLRMEGRACDAFESSSDSVAEPGTLPIRIFPLVLVSRL